MHLLRQIQYSFTTRIRIFITTDTAIENLTNEDILSYRAGISSGESVKYSPMIINTFQKLSLIQL